MKNEFIKLTNNFLYRDDVPKADILKKINSFIESTFLNEDLVLAQNIINTYRTDFNNFCVDNSNEHLQRLIPCFTLILSLLNHQE